MDWQMIGALGEILGAIGVITTLGYLASQIRQSRAESQQAAVEELLGKTDHFLAQIASSVESARLWRLGMANDENLSIDEVIQFRVLLMQLSYIWERLHHLAERGHVDSWVVESNAASRGDVLGAPGFRLWFESRKHWLSPGYRELLEREIPRASGYSPLGISDRDVPQ